MSDRCLRDTSRGCNGSAAADLEALLDYLVVQTPDPHQATGESYFWPRRGGGGPLAASPSGSRPLAPPPSRPCWRRRATITGAGNLPCIHPSR
jgi:hypothetical protein